MACHPEQATLLFAGQVGVTGAYVLALSFSLRAFGAHPLIHLAAAYLAGAAIGAVSPAPYGVGAIEAALVGALTRFNAPQRLGRRGRPGLPPGHLLAAHTPRHRGVPGAPPQRGIVISAGAAPKLHGTAAGCG